MNQGHVFLIYGKHLPPTHRSRGTVHEQWLQMHCQWLQIWDVITHISSMGRHRMFKLGGVVDHVTCHV